MTHEVRLLAATDEEVLLELAAVFGKAFNDQETYIGSPPSSDYLRKLLASDSFIGLVAESDGSVVGGIAAYELRKLESERSEIYLYDLAVLESHRRRGVATALIERLCDLARDRGAWVVYVQADTGEEDAAAIALYSKLGSREDVLHFDIPV